jgi:hypothetical protein
VEEDRRAQARAGREILVFGSRTLWNDLLVGGLVDELHPDDRRRRGGRGHAGVRRGSGDAAPARGVRRSDDSANVLVRYEVGR